MNRLNHIFATIKKNHNLHFKIECLKKLVNKLQEKDYQEYYEVEHIIDENDERYHTYEISFKIKNGDIIHFMSIKYHEMTASGHIHYNYGENDTANRLLLHFLGDLLKDNNNIY